MPNWCDNTLIVTGSNDRVKQFYDQNIKQEGAETIFAFNNTYPCPNENDWYNWRINNWGTKWEGDVYYTEITDNKIVIGFNSAWSPPDLWIKYVAQNIFPDLYFHLSYIETGEGFCGVFEGNKEEGFYSNDTEPIEADEEGKEVQFSAEDERYRYVETGKIIEDEDFIPNYINPLI